jgi:23S rRNA pseudouridine1911/1915/1917 synthase
MRSVTKITLIKEMKKHPKYSFTVVHQDKDMLVVNKPAGLLTVPIPKMEAVNLQQLVRQHFGNQARPVHRIDRYTSGLVVFSLGRKSYNELKRQFREHEPQRLYLAVIRGIPKKEEDTLVHYMKRVKSGFRNVLVRNAAEGTEARLYYQVIEKLKNASLVLIALDTGLKNQIRVQFKAIGYPIVGDRHYHEPEAGEPLIDRQALHAAQINLLHPVTGEQMEFRCDPPDDMEKLIKKLRSAG